MKENKYKDTMFRSFFGDRAHLLSMLNAFLGTNATDYNEIKINTLDGLFFDKVKNDISCIFRDRYLVIIEHQSTINNNMPLRCLFYVSELYKSIVKPYSKDIYKKRMIELPQPEFFVLYNGNEKLEEQQTLRLSDSFNSDKNNLELIVKLYNINKGNNLELINKSEDLKFYCTFVNRVKYNKSCGMSQNNAIDEAYRYCMDQNLMIDYLREYREELSNMYWFEYDPELAKQARLEEAYDEGLELGREEGRKEGIAEGRAEDETEKMLEMVKNLIMVGTPMNFIVKATGWTEEQILKVAEQN